ncbi:hypothetical protein LCGC14_1584210 [marine sediment metagenome]|uniref:Uncharacterized protein n=1 Tax=marine sediment metagenome TaxID=412755 RepID=A0A0F9J267_9ZZZZ
MVKFLERVKKFRERRKEKRILSTAKRGIKAEKQRKLQSIRIEEARLKQKEIAGFRKAQAERIKAEASILEARARQQKARRRIANPIQNIGMAAAAGFGQTQPVQIGLSKKTIASRKKKKLGPTPGLGRFRII